jgi:DNA-binding response OmpR family regulator
MLGLSILIVEEEYLVAAAMESALLGEGCSVAIARSVEHVDPRAPGIDLAIVEAQLGAPAVIAFVNALHAAGVATVVTSADRAVASLFTGSVPLEKPFDDATLVAACETARRLTGRSVTYSEAP